MLPDVSTYLVTASAPINWKGLHPTALKSMCDFVCDFQKLWFGILEVREFRLQVFSEVLSHRYCNTYSTLVMWNVPLQEKMFFFLLLLPPPWIRHLVILQLALAKDRWRPQSNREAVYVLRTPIYLCKVHWCTQSETNVFWPYKILMLVHCVCQYSR